MANGKAVAFLAREIGGSSASEMLFRGALSAVERSGQDLVVFRGGYFGKDPGATIYSLVNESFLGALNWASPDKDKAQNAHYRLYDKLPLVTLTQHLPPHPVVVNDSHSGMQSIVDHLITVHGKRRIVFCRGPEEHPLAQERFQAYKEVLTAHGIALDERLLSPFGNWNRDRGLDLIRLFIDERGLKVGQDFDAVVCVNDNIAIGAIEECQRRGIRVPEDLAVTGCNDIFDARVNMPPVTTVALRGDTQVACALEILNAKARGGAVQEITKLPGQAVLRQSCGCASEQIALAASGLVSRHRFAPLALLGGLLRSCGMFSAGRARAEIVRALASQFKNADEHRALFDQVADRLVEALNEEMGWGRKVGALNQALGEAVLQFEAADLSADVLQLAISVLRRHRMPSLWRRGRILRAEDLFSQARVLLSELSVQIHETASMKALELERSVSQLGAKMTTTQETSALIKLLQGELPKLGIPAFYLGVYEGEPGWDRLSVPARLRILMAYDKASQPRMDNESMAVSELIPRILRSGRQRQTLVAVPLHFNELQIGVAVFVLGPWDGTLYESLKVQLSSSLYGSLLRQTLRDTLSGMERKVAAVSGNSEQIKDSVRGGSSAMEGVAESIHAISKHVQEVTQVINDAVRLAADAANDITVLNKQSQEISKVTGLITEIAEQTNMLSLNAAIEAARAGEAGRGFAVVAEEVKSLAVNTVNSSANIRKLIQSVQENTTRVHQSIDGMNAIMKKIEQLSSGIAGGISEQEVSTNEIANILTEAAQGTEEIAAALAELDALSREAGRL